MVGVDGSRTSLAAAGWAARLAAATGAELIAVTTWHSNQAELPPATAEATEDDIAAGLERIAAPLRDVGLRMRTEVHEGAPERLGELADEKRVDLLVVGTHGLGGFTPLHLGSLTRHLARRVDRPLALIPDPADDDELTAQRITAIAVDIDESAGADAAVRFCAEIAPGLDATVVALTGDEPEDEADRAELHHRTAALDRAGVITEMLIRRDAEPAAGLVGLAGRVQLVVIGADGLGSVLGLRFGGTAMELLDQTRVPMVIVPPDEPTDPTPKPDRSEESRT